MKEINNITIIIPTHRNDKRFIRALQSSTWASEILIIDQNSHNDWDHLKKKFAFQLQTYPTLESFSKMKNEAMAKVKTEWVFFLDSDEYISDELKTEIEAIVATEQIDGLILKRTDVFLGKQIFHGETRDAKFLRIVKKDKAKWHGTVHEELKLQKNSQEILLKSPLYHEPHTAIYEFIQKVNLYTSVLAKHKERHSLLKGLFLPIGKFIYTFYLKLGFLDGYRGLVYSLIMSLHSSIVRVKRYES